MRDVVLGDVIAAARALRSVRPGLRRFVLTRMCREAASARRHYVLTRRSHRRWGDGSLMTAALRRRPVPEPPLSDPEYRACLILVLQALDC
jgi:hypothetical protein